MKEHRTKALRVTTTNNIRDSSDMFSSLQLLRLELDVRPDVTPLRCIQQPADGRCKGGSASYHHQCPEPKSISAMLQDCMSCENVPMAVSDLLLASSTHLDHHELKNRYQKYGDAPLAASASLHITCASTSPLFQRLRPGVGDFGRLSSSIQLLLTGDLQGNWTTVIDAVKRLPPAHRERDRHPLLSVTDGEGNTALLIAGRRLLKEGAFARAAQLGNLLLQAGADPDAVNAEGRSLLTYAVHHVDDGVELTRALLNAGASVWPLAATECSAFTWFLRAVIRRRRLDERCQATLHLLSEVMGEQPVRMHGHVMRTMFKHAKCYKVLGPVFYQLKVAMMVYWSQPQGLQFLCRKAVRSAVCIKDGKSVGDQLRGLGLPNSMHQYLVLE